jgi:hypothetical protein
MKKLVIWGCTNVFPMCTYAVGLLVALSYDRVHCSEIVTSNAPVALFMRLRGYVFDTEVTANNKADTVLVPADHESIPLTHNERVRCCLPHESHAQEGVLLGFINDMGVVKLDSGNKILEIQLRALSRVGLPPSLNSLQNVNEDSEFNVRRADLRWLIQLFGRVGDYQELISPLLHHDAVSTCLELMNLKCEREGFYEALLMFDVIDMLASFMAHKKYISLFCDRGGFPVLLRLGNGDLSLSLRKRTADCLICLSSCKPAMEKVIHDEPTLKALMRYAFSLFGSDDAITASVCHFFVNVSAIIHTQVFYSICFHYSI